MESLKTSWLDVVKTIQSSLPNYYSPEESRNIASLWVQEHFGLNKTSLLTAEKFVLKKEEEEQIKTAIHLLSKGIPVQYVLKRSYFLGLPIQVNPHVLIPRQETEELVNTSLQLINHLSQPKVIDLCTGSGCIALAIAHFHSGSQLLAFDLSLPALEMAHANAIQLCLENKIKFAQLDILSQNIELKGIDLVVSNPPYVMESEKSTMLPNVVDHEPALALFVPDDNPLMFYQAIAEKAIQWLNVEGWIVFEINEKFGYQIKNLLVEIGFENVSIQKDLHSKDRIAMGQKKID